MLCFGKLPVANRFMDNKGVFGLTVRRQFVEEPFCALLKKKSGSEKVFE